MSRIVFNYRGLDSRGAPASGTVEAADKEDALRKLRSLETEGLCEIVIEEVSVDDRATVNGHHAPQQPKKTAPLLVLAVVAGIIVLLAAGLCRVYYGGGVGIQIVYKHSFSFQDTIVNLDDLIGQPRIVIAAKHPAVKRQLEEMGMIESDEQAVASAISGVTKAMEQAAGAVVKATGQKVDEERIATAKADILTNIATALKLYELDNGSFPSTDEGLSALLGKPSSASNWNGPYLEKMPIDPWGREYRYVFPGKHGDYDLISFGQDGREGTHDDITSWK